MGEPQGARISRRRTGLVQCFAPISYCVLCLSSLIWSMLLRVWLLSHSPRRTVLESWEEAKDGGCTDDMLDWWS